MRTPRLLARGFLFETDTGKMRLCALVHVFKNIENFLQNELKEPPRLLCGGSFHHHSEERALILCATCKNRMIIWK